MKLRKWTAILLAALMLCSAAGCSKQAEAPATTAEETVAETETVVETTEAETEESVEEESTAVDDASYLLETADKLLTIKMPNKSWYQIINEEHTEMFSDGDCAIHVDLYKITDTIPKVEMNDKDHALVYSASVSVGDYVMQVVGYAHSQEDFSGIGIAVNSIVVDKNAITEEMFKHEIEEAKFSIRDVKYSAWVDAENLNVRSDSGKEAKIITALKKNTKVTVVGEVLKDDKDYGWSLIKMENGKKGYVSAQFLTTKEPKKEVTKTGYNITLYPHKGNPVVVFEYSDGSWKDNNGHKYVKYNSGQWKCDTGEILDVTEPKKETQPETKKETEPETKKETEPAPTAAPETQPETQGPDPDTQTIDFSGSYKNDNEDTVVIKKKDNGTFSIEVALDGLAVFECKKASVEDQALWFTCTDPSDGPVTGCFYSAGGTYTVEFSSIDWDYLKDGTAITGFKK